MLVTYLRSSSVGTYSLCEFQYYLSYSLGLYSKPNYKTERGSIVHKALELLAHRKVCEQDGTAEFFEQEVGQTFRAADVTVEAAVDAAWSHYTAKNESGHAWSSKEYAECLGWTRDVVGYNDGMFDPLRRKVVCPERYFDLTVDEPWSWYSYTDPHTGEKVRGQLAIKGSVDLITEAAPNVLELLDWKSGRRWNWAEDKPKEYADFEDDPQLLLYFYALTRLYPEYANVFVTIFYAQDGGPFSLCYDHDVHVPKTLRMLRRKFEAIKNNHRPARIKTDSKKRWKCRSFCYYEKFKFTHEDGTVSDKSICDHIHGEVQQLGLEKVMKKHGKPSAYMAYGSGGGVTNREVANTYDKGATNA